MSLVGPLSGCALALPVWLAVCGAGAGADAGRLTGREIYRQQCAKCHGRNGEGVKGKHDEPLAGAGGRSAIKVPANVRPDPFAPGNGRARALGRG